jgi:hypothetical protein
MWSS